RKLGVDPYPHRFEAGTTIDAIVTEHGSRSSEQLEAAQAHVRTAGRILAIRSFGKANFLVISDGRARVQVYIKQEGLAERDFKIFKLLDLGDWIGIEGRLFRTRTNELTIWASKLEFLAKCLLPLPEKWHGLQERMDLDAAQSRVHDAGVLLGVRGLQRPDDADRGDAAVCRAEGRRGRRRDVQRPLDFLCASVPPRIAA